MTVIADQPLIEQLIGFNIKMHDLVVFGLEALAVWFVATTWAKTKSVAPTVGALLLGAVVVWGIRHDDVLISQIREDTGTPTLVEHHPPRRTNRGD